MSLEVHAAASVHTVLWNEPPSGLLLLADHTLKMETKFPRNAVCGVNPAD